jgi:hypothetical protein
MIHSHWFSITHTVSEPLALHNTPWSTVTGSA